MYKIAFEVDDTVSSSLFGTGSSPIKEQLGVEMAFEVDDTVSSSLSSD